MEERCDWLRDTDLGLTPVFWAEAPAGMEVDVQPVSPFVAVHLVHPLQDVKCWTCFQCDSARQHHRAAQSEQQPRRT